MTDKIKVWKCEECSSPCIGANMATDNRSVSFTGCPEGHDHPNWQPTTAYQITERKPTQIGASVMGIGHPYNRTVEVWTMPPQPRKRIKIIWSEVNAENVEMAAVLKNLTKPFRSDAESLTGLGGVFVNVSDIPKSWLEKIDDEPVSAECYAHSKQGGEKAFDWNEKKFSLFDIFHAFQDGEENNELRHTPRQSFDEWWLRDGCREVSTDHMVFINQLMCYCWKACKKSHSIP